MMAEKMGPGFEPCRTPLKRTLKLLSFLKQYSFEKLQNVTLLVFDKIKQLTKAYLLTLQYSLFKKSKNVNLLAWHFSWQLLIDGCSPLSRKIRNDDIVTHFTFVLLHGPYYMNYKINRCLVINRFNFHY
jgi:hypothetical protein